MNVPLSKILLAAVCVGLAALATIEQLDYRAQTVVLRHLLQQTGLELRQPAIAERARREADPAWATIAVARALVAEGYDGRWLAALPAEQAAAELAKIDERLRHAEQLSRQVLLARPTNWEAATLVGGAALLIDIRSGSNRLLQGREVWQLPLQTAVRLAPAQVEPARMLALAYLTIWPALDEEQRRASEPLIQHAMLERATFPLLVEMWLQVAPDRQAFWRIVPDRSFAWEHLQKTFARRQEWEDLAEAFRRWDEALYSELFEQIEEAERLLRMGDSVRSRRAFLGVAAATREDVRYLSLLTHALEKCPGGPVVPRFATTLHRKLGYVLSRCARGPCLSERALRRLAGASSERSPVEEGLLAIALNDLPRAARAERQSHDPRSLAWAPYWLFKARHLLERGDPARAREALSRLPREAAFGSSVLQTRRAIARALSDRPALEQTNAQISRMERPDWPASTWRWYGSSARAALYPAGTSTLVEIDLDRVPGAGAVIELIWDGASVAVQAVRRGETKTLNFRVPATSGPITLELKILAGNGVAPGAIRVSS